LDLIINSGAGGSFVTSNTKITKMKRMKCFYSLSLVAMVALGFTACQDDEDVAVTGVTLDVHNTIVRINASQALTASIQPIDATKKSVSWVSRNAAIATVSADGVITGVANGETYVVVATNEGSFKDSCYVAVTKEVAGSEVTLSGNITTNTLLVSDVKYILDGWVYVKEGATLTIQPGTIIKGKTDTKASLIIERGAKIIAEGTSEKPIVFTSDKAVGSRTRGDWGGIILCGKGIINPTGGEAEIEGGVGSKYGGTDNTDNSGVLKYVRIEYAGYAFATDKEINGLTLGGVGSGTTIDYVQVSYSNDDSFEWFGGAVNCSHLIAFRGLDDEFDTDYGFSGNVQFAVGLRDPEVADISKSNGFESDNDGSGSTNAPLTNPKFANVSLYGPMPTATSTYNSLFQSAMHLRRKTALEVYNSVFAGWPKGLLMADKKGNAGDIKIKGCVMSGMLDNYSGNTAGEEAFYTTADYQNRLITENSSLKVADAFNLTAPNFLPQTGSPLLTGGVTLPAGLEATTYVGAFGTTDWTSGWANWTPQTTVY